MADSRARTLAAKAGTSVAGLQTAAATLLARLRDEAGGLAARTGRQWALPSPPDGRRLPEEFRRRSEQLLHNLEAKRAGLRSTLEVAVTSLVRAVANRLDVASQAEVAALSARLTGLEHRLTTVTRESVARDPEDANSRAVNDQVACGGDSN